MRHLPRSAISDLCSFLFAYPSHLCYICCSKGGDHPAVLGQKRRPCSRIRLPGTGRAMELRPERRPDSVGCHRRLRDNHRQGFDSNLEILLNEYQVGTEWTVPSDAEIGSDTWTAMLVGSKRRGANLSFFIPCYRYASHKK